ncbi:hypothetical protein I6M33_12315 [Shewanella algae]|uniref:hypothetical protein n=1 Tax=Shewanella algae TaxID=38313 RepID=UPI001AACCB98|nr:hypothetical protein [Shewanella algae]MBO2561386.1 hypothetical protein [Shewanella algae]HDS1204674.1 hypothetical protein [Shewanella algae]
MIVQLELEVLAKESLNIINELDDKDETLISLVHGQIDTHNGFLITDDHDLPEETNLIDTMLVNGRTTALDVMQHFEPSLREYMNGN